MTRQIRTTLLTLLFFFGLLSVLKAQDTTLAKVPEPEFANEPMLLNDNDYTISAIPTERAEMEQKNKVSKTESFYVLKSSRSTLRLPSGKTIKIIVNHSPSGFLSSVNPKDYYKIYKLTVDDKKGKRRCPFVTFEYKGFSNNTTTIPPATIPATFKKVRDNIYLISLDNLEQGEYAISIGMKMFTFGID